MNLESKIITLAPDQKWVSGDDIKLLLKLVGELGVNSGLTAAGVVNIGQGGAEHDIQRAFLGGIEVLVGIAGAIRGAEDFENLSTQLDEPYSDLPE